MTETIDKKLEAYKDHTKTGGEHLVKVVFPQRVFQMEELLKTDLYNLDAKRVYQEINLPTPLIAINCKADGDSAMGVAKMEESVPGCPVYAFPGGVVQHNVCIKEMIENTKPHLQKLMVEAQQVRLWIQFNVPKIEDGNNFGVGIQEEVLSETSGVERDALTFLDQFTRYYASRGKLVGKVAKYPHIDDFRECIRDMDEKQAISMRYVIQEIRNHYAVLHDLIVKNLERIKKPRNNNTSSMY